MRLGADLPELAVAPGLGALVTEEAREVPELDGLATLVHAVLDVGAADGGGALGAQRERARGGVLEGEHLLAHDVGGLADAAGEQLGRLEGGRLDPLVAGALEQGAGARLERGARLGADSPSTSNVPRGALSLGALNFRRRSRRARRRLHAARARAARSRNGLVSRSRPSVVTTHVAGVDDGLGGKGAQQAADRALERGPVAAGQIDATDGALEEHVAGEQRAVAAACSPPSALQDGAMA